jgi:hypothetical protein
MFMRKIIFASVAAMAMASSGCVRNSSEVSGRNVLQYGQPDEKLPLKWFVAGNTDSQCSLAVPPEVVDAINVAWTEANELLGVKLERIARDAQLDFQLTEVSVLLGSERVLVLNGCIGGKVVEGSSYPSMGQPMGLPMGQPMGQPMGMPPGQPITPAYVGTSVSGNCGVVSPEVNNLKIMPLVPTASCPSNLVAGFAMRTNHRDVTLTANFKIKGATLTVSAKPFDLNSIETVGNASASISSFGAAILPLSPIAKAAAAALLDKVGSVNFSANFAAKTTVIPDASYSKVNYPAGSRMVHVSKLAEKIATGILGPACVAVAEKLGGIKVSDCEIRDYLAAQGSLETLELYKNMPVKLCEQKDLMGAYFYALARKPDAAANEVDFLVSGSNPSKLSVYQIEDSPVKQMRYRSWVTYQGDASDPKKCGSIEAGERCIVVHMGTSGFSSLGGGSCLAINNRLSRISLSLATSPTVNL